jgi:ABC-2 type transport system permease protein
MSKLQLIIQREFIAKVRNKSFIMMTFFKSHTSGCYGGLGFLLNEEKR